MSERDGFEHGVPCWVDHSSADPQGAADFYGALFGWEAEDRMPPEAPGSYFMCRLRGRDVAALSSQQSESARATWNTYVWVDSADEAVERAKTGGAAGQGARRRRDGAAVRHPGGPDRGAERSVRRGVRGHPDA
jgi:uncharacterized protein